MDTAQRNLLIFLCSLVLLTVIAVLAATFGFPVRSDTTETFAKWGQAAVLGEIVALFLLIARNIFSDKGGAFSLVVSPKPEWSSLDLAWKNDACFIRFGTEKFPVYPALSPVGAAWEIRLPGNIYRRLKDTDVLELFLTDQKGNQWEGGAFFLFQKQLHLNPISDEAKILNDYGISDD